MKELSTSELQEQLLRIMVDVQQFCDANSISYSLAYGTLIGAIRHKGFIPWDDDADFMMPRPDYEKFCANYHSDRYRLIYYGNDKTALACFARVVDCQKTHYQTERPWTAQDSGVWLDIIPVDGAEDNLEAYARRYAKLKKWCKLVYKFRRQNHHIQAKDSLWSKTKTIVARVIGLGGIVGALGIKYLNNVIRKYPYEKSKYLCQCSIQDDGPIMFPSEDFAQYTPVEFEKHTFKAIIGYDHHLRQLYGNYMQMPPAEKQGSHQWWIKFYWKEQ